MAEKMLMARIEDNAVVACPVDEEYANERNNPLDNYIPVIESTAPEYNHLTQKVVTTYNYRVTFVLQIHTVVERTIEELLVDVKATGTDDGNGGVTLSIQNVPIPLIMAVAHAATAKAQGILDQFVKSRGYDNIASACTYVNSNFPKFKNEGQYCIDLRDQTWAALYGYLNSVQEGTLPVPQQWSDIAAILPVPAWPN